MITLVSLLVMLIAFVDYIRDYTVVYCITAVQTTA